jgi:dTDP-glucose pyrophosphorylase
VLGQNQDIAALLIDPGTTVFDAISIIDEGAVQVAFVVDGDNVVLGSITDGDVRRGLLGGLSLSEPVSKIMNSSFRWVGQDALLNEVRDMMQRESLHQVPVLDAEGRIVGLNLLNDLIAPQARANWVILMAGGRGARLMPITASQPKPMVSVKGKPILEILMARCKAAGFADIFISVNHLKHKIMEHFGDGSHWGVSVRYLEEDHPLGTAGPLSLLPSRPVDPIIVINGDILSDVDLSLLLRFHLEHGAAVTVCVRPYETQIPFGVVQVDGIYVQSFEEKPVLTHFVNAGIYILNPEVLDVLPAEQAFDMPELLDQVQGSGLPVVVFPIHEYWLDVGTPSALAKANGEWF